jgi:protein tyrosine phosphatase
LITNDPWCTTSYLIAHSQAYRKQTHLIATQAPLPSTVTDFWNVICDQKIKVIVHLDSLLVSIISHFVAVYCNSISTKLIIGSSIGTKAADAPTAIKKK